MTEVSAISPASDSAHKAADGRLPRWLMAGFLAFLPVQIPSGGPGSTRIAPSDLFLILYCVATIREARVLRVAVFSRWHLALLFVFSVGTYIGVFETGALTQYMVVNKGFGLLLLFGVYAAVAAEARTSEDLRRMLRVMILSVTVMNILALVSFYGYAPWLAENVFRVEYAARLAGMLIDPNAYGGLLAVTIAIHVSSFYSKAPIVGGPIGLIAVITLAFGVLLTYSRSAWISSVLIILGLVFVNKRACFALVGTIVLLLVAFVATADQAALNDMIRMASRPEQVESRLDIISKAIPMFLESPIWGVGLGTFFEAHRIIIHNTPAWFLTEFGLLGLFVFAGYALWLWRRSILAYANAAPRDKAIVHGLAMAHTAMIGLSLGVEALYQRHWWVAAGLIAALSTNAFRAGSAQEK